MYKYRIYGLGGITQENVIEDFAVTGFPNVKKPVITKNINKIIDKYRPTKIKTGKTGDYDNRRKQYIRYKKMFLLYLSKNETSVEKLETYYTDYLKKKHPNIVANVNRGSAGDMTTKNGRYSLYLVTN